MLLKVVVLVLVALILAAGAYSMFRDKPGSGTEP
jgi:hypothetical protein